MATIFIKDTFRAAVEAASGGLVTVLYSHSGHPGYYRVVPRFNVEDIDAGLGTGTHPAFVSAGGFAKPEIFVGQFDAVIVDGKALSLPGRVPSYANYDNAVAYCRAIGPGFHLMTAFEYAALALWCQKNGYLPAGNTDYGRSFGNKNQVGVCVDGLAPGTLTNADLTTRNGHTLTGSGPLEWRHDKSPAGIADLAGNGWQWAAGVRLKDGEIQFIDVGAVGVVNNDAAHPSANHGASSTQWKAVNSSGSIVAPGTAGSLKYDATSAGTTNGTNYGVPILKSTIANRNGTVGNDANSVSSGVYPAFASGNYKDVVASGVAAPNILKQATMFPNNAASLTDNLWVRNFGERMLMVGGSNHNQADAGVFARSFLYGRAGTAMVRPVFIP